MTERLPNEPRIVVGGFVFWPLVFLPWLTGTYIIVKATITYLF